jgi:hypothetical protein
VLGDHVGKCFVQFGGEMRRQMLWEGDHLSNLFEEEDEQSSSQQLCFGQLHFSPLICDLFLITPLSGSKLLILFNFTPKNFNSIPRFHSLFPFGP